MVGLSVPRWILRAIFLTFILINGGLSQIRVAYLGTPNLWSPNDANSVWDDSLELENLVGLINQNNVNFSVILGDLAGGCDSLRYVTIKNILAGLDSVYYVIPGDQDCSCSPAGLSQFTKHFAYPPTIATGTADGGFYFSRSNWTWVHIPTVRGITDSIPNYNPPSDSIKKYLSVTPANYLVVISHHVFLPQFFSGMINYQMLQDSVKKHQNVKLMIGANSDQFYGAVINGTYYKIANSGDRAQGYEAWIVDHRADGDLRFTLLKSRTSPDGTPPDSAASFVVVSNNPEEITTSVSGWPSDGESWTIRYRTDGQFPTNNADGLLWINGTKTTRTNATASVTAGTYYFALFQSDTMGNWQKLWQANRAIVTVQAAGGGIAANFYTGFERGIKAQVWPAGGDSVGALQGTADIVSATTGQVYAGDSALYCPNGTSIIYDIANDDLLSSDSGVVKFRVYFDTSAVSPLIDNMQFFKVSSAGVPYMYLRTKKTAAHKLRFVWNDGVNSYVIDGVNDVIFGKQWLEVFLMWNTATDSIKLGVTGVDTIATTATIAPWTDAETEIQIGFEYSGTNNTYYDEFRVWKSWKDTTSGGSIGDNIAPSPPSTFIAVAKADSDSISISSGGYAVDTDTIRLNWRSDQYPISPTDGTLILATRDTNAAKTISVVDNWPPGTVVYLALWVGDSLLNWASVQDTAEFPPIHPNPPSNFVVSFNSSKDSIRVQYSGIDSWGIVQYSSAGYPSDTLSGTRLIKSNLSPLDTTIAFGAGTWYFSAFNDSVGFISMPSQDTAVYIPPASDTLLTISGTRRPRIWLNRDRLQEIANYVSTYESSNFSTFISTVESRHSSSLAAMSDAEVKYSTVNNAFLALAKKSGFFTGFTFGKSVRDYVRRAFESTVEAWNRAKSTGNTDWMQMSASGNWNSSKAGYGALFIAALFDWCRNDLTTTEADTVKQILEWCWDNRIYWVTYEPSRTWIDNKTDDLQDPLALALALKGETLPARLQAKVDSAQYIINSSFLDGVLKLGQKVFGDYPYATEGDSYWLETSSNIMASASAITTALTDSLRNLFTEFHWLRNIPLYDYFMGFPFLNLAAGQPEPGSENIRPWNRANDSQWLAAGSGTILSSIQWGLGNIKRSDAILAGFYRWWLESSDQKITPGNKAEDQATYFWLFPLFINGIRDVTPQTPDQANISNAYESNLTHIFRSAWDSTSIWIEFESGKYWLNPHKASSQNMLQVYKKGLLVLKEGNQKSSSTFPRRYGFGDEPIASGWNFVVFDNSSVDTAYAYDATFVGNAYTYNDPAWGGGGNNWIGDWQSLVVEDTAYYVDYEHTNRWRLLSGLQKLVRRMVYFPPIQSGEHDLLIVQDYYKGDAAYGRKLLMNTSFLPVIEGSSWNVLGTDHRNFTGDSTTVYRIDNTYANHSGRGFFRVLHPGNHTAEAVGYDQKYWRWTNFNYVPEGSTLRYYDAWCANWAGGGRVEFSGAGGGEEVFLSVMEVGEVSELVAMDAVTKVRADSMIGVMVQNRVAMFPQYDNIVQSQDYNLTGSGTIYHVIGGLKTGNYSVKQGTSVIANGVVSGDAIYFKSNGGGTFSISVQ